MIEAGVSIFLGMLSALIFYFLSAKKCNLLTRVCVDVVYSFLSIFALYVSEFFITNGNVLPYVYVLFALAFFVTCSFIYPRSTKKSK